MASSIIAALSAAVVALLPVLAEWLLGRLRKPETTPEELLEAGHLEARDRLAEGLASGDGDAIAAAFEYNEELAPHELRSFSPSAGAGPGPLFAHRRPQKGSEPEGGES